jgi:hypothetical protein
MIRLMRATLAGCLAALCAPGCSSSPTRPAELSEQEQAIVNVGLAYRDASVALNRGPANEQELMPYLKKYGDPNQVLVSPSDGQPYQITWGLTPSRPTKAAVSQRFLVYEQTGKNGKRYAVDIKLKVYHLSDGEFAKLQGAH